MKRNNSTPSLTSPKGSKRGCLCKNNTYSTKCCDGSLQAQGIGQTSTTTENANKLKINIKMDNKKRALDLINAYLEKQNKTELATQKVELGLLQDINSDYDFIRKNFSSSESKFYDAIETASTNKKLVINDLNKLDRLQSDILKAEAKLKEIGLDNQIAELNKIKPKLDEMIKSANRIKNINI